MRAAVLKSGGRFAVEDVPDPVPAGRQAVIRVIYCGICGSDLHALRAGTLPEGAILGHEIVGEITALGPEARGFEVGDRVTTLSAVPCDSCPQCEKGMYRSCEKGWQVFGYTGLAGGYAEYLLTHTAVLLKAPEELSDLGAALNEPSMVGLYAARASKVRVGDNVAIIGAGPIGLLVLQSVLLMNPANCWVIETSAGRRAKALELGATAAFDPTDIDMAAFFLANCDMGGPDVIFECAGAKGTLQRAIEWVRAGGQVMVPGVNMEEDEVSPLTMVGKECEVKASLGGMDLFRPALDLLSKGKIQPEAMVTKVIGLDEVDEVCQTLGTRGDDNVKVLVAPGKGAK
ncbi:MAG: alcohol dehydrogenase catalytic domain-containing protein [Dehalococcoidia bacterium]|nr:alcohol dehydrogenase catalytic domain-containing protein [Dehalococcoidia bacterium]